MGSILFNGTLMHMKFSCAPRHAMLLYGSLYGFVAVGMLSAAIYHIAFLHVAPAEVFSGYLRVHPEWPERLTAGALFFGSAIFAALSLASLKAFAKRDALDWVADRRWKSRIARVVVLVAVAPVAVSGWLFLSIFLSPIEAVTNQCVDSFISMRCKVKSNNVAYREMLDVQLLARGCGKYDAALSAAKFRKQHIDDGCSSHDEEKVSLYSEIGELYELKREYPKAEEFYRKAAVESIPDLAEILSTLKKPLAAFGESRIGSLEHPVATMATFYHRHGSNEKAQQFFALADEYSTAMRQHYSFDRAEFDTQHAGLSDDQYQSALDKISKIPQQNAGRYITANEFKPLLNARAFHTRSKIIGSDFPNVDPQKLTSRELSKFYVDKVDQVN